MPNGTAPATTIQGRPPGGRSRLCSWTLGTAAIATIAMLPVLAVVILAFTPGDDIWQHLVSTVLPLYVTTTLQLMIGVGLGTFAIGVGGAWLVTMHRFPGKKIFEWALLLPMAMPAYVVAYVYTDLLEYAGPVQGMLRDIFGWTTMREYWFPEIRSLGGAISMMTLVLYPYVYLLSRAAFLEQSVCVLEASRVLGRSQWQSFYSVALPLARPAIVIGLALVLMETLNDFGTVDFFAVYTFTLGIFDVWMNMSNIAGAAQLASLLLLFVMALILTERYARRKQSFQHTSATYKALPGYLIGGWKGWLAMVVCALPVILGFVLPSTILSIYAVTHFDQALNGTLMEIAWNSLMLSGAAALLAVLVAIFLAYGVRLKGSPFLRTMTRVASMGYAVPGSVLAVGVIAVLTSVDNSIDHFMHETFGYSTGLIFSGTVAAVIFGYLVRFLAPSYGTIEASLGKITPSMDGAARTLGHGAFATLKRVHMPLMKTSILTAAILVFVDGMKELPLTIILRPFNFQTLATYVHQFASDEQLGEASLAALTIVGTGIIPVILLSYAIRSSRPGQKTRIKAR